MTDLDQIISQCVLDIWDRFDTDHSGTLDYIETKKLVEFILGPHAKKFTDSEFRFIFNEFDKNGDELIS